MVIKQYLESLINNQTRNNIQNFNTFLNSLK